VEEFKHEQDSVLVESTDNPDARVESVRNKFVIHRNANSGNSGPHGQHVLLNADVENDPGSDSAIEANLDLETVLVMSYKCKNVSVANAHTGPNGQTSLHVAHDVTVDNNTEPDVASMV